MARQLIFEEPSRWWWRRPLPTLTLVVAMALGVQVASPRAHADSTRILLKDVRFSPERIEVPVGDTVVWEAKDDRHTVTARNGEFDSSRSGLMEDGDEFRRRFTTAGTYPYFCRVRQDEGMQGEIVVLGNPADRAAASPPTTSATPAAPVPAQAPAPEAAAVVPPSTTATAPPSTTTTSRPLATSSTMNLATTTTGPITQPVTPHEPPTVDPDAETAAPPEASLPGTPTALRRHRNTSPSSGVGGAGGIGLIAALLAAAAAGMIVVARHRLRHPRPPA